MDSTSCTGREEKLVVHSSLFTATDSEREREVRVTEAERESVRERKCSFWTTERGREGEEEKKKRAPDQKQQRKGRKTLSLSRR